MRQIATITILHEDGGTWEVFSHATGESVCIDGVAQSGLTREEAVRVHALFDLDARLLKDRQDRNVVSFFGKIREMDRRRA